MDFPEVSTKKPQGFNASKEGFTRKTEGGSKSPNLAGEGPSRRTEGFKMDAAGDSHETTLVSSSDNDPITEYEIKQKKHRSERVGRMIGEPLTTSDRSSDRRSPNEERNKEGTDKRGHKEETDERNSKDKRSYGKEDSLNKRRASIYGQEDKGESEKRIYADDNADKRGHKEEKRMAKEEVQDKRRHKHRYSHEKQSYNEKGKYDEKPSYNEEEGDVNEDTGHMSQVAKNAGEDERRDSRSDARKSRSSLDIERQVKRAEKDGYREGRPDKENHREGRTDKDGHKDGRTEKDVYKERESYRQGKARTKKDIPKGKDKRSGEDGKSSAIGPQGEKDFEAREAERRHQEDLNQCRRNNEHIKQIVEKYNDSLRNPVTVQVQFQQEGPLHGEKIGDKNGPNSAHTNGRKTSLPEKTDRMSTSRNDHEDRKLLTRHEVQSGNFEPAENVRNFPTRREVHSGNSDDQEQAMRRSGKYKRGKYYPLFPHFTEDGSGVRRTNSLEHMLADEGLKFSTLPRYHSVASLTLDETGESRCYSRECVEGKTFFISFWLSAESPNNIHIYFSGIVGFASVRRPHLCSISNDRPIIISSSQRPQYIYYLQVQ